MFSMLAQCRLLFSSHKTIHTIITAHNVAIIVVERFNRQHWKHKIHSQRDNKGTTSCGIYGHRLLHHHIKANAQDEIDWRFVSVSHMWMWSILFVRNVSVDSSTSKIVMSHRATNGSCQADAWMIGGRARRPISRAITIQFSTILLTRFRMSWFLTRFYYHFVTLRVARFV